MMKENDRDNFDDLFRSKLQNYGVETMSDDWEAIVKRLPHKSVPFYRRMTYRVAAAAALLVMIVGSIYLFDKEEGQLPIVAHEIEAEIEKIETQLKEEIHAFMENTAPIHATTQSKTTMKQSRQAIALPAQTKKAILAENEIKTELVGGHTKIADEVKKEVEKANDVLQSIVSMESHSLIADASTLPVKTGKAKSPRKWGFGMGAGSLSVGADNVVPQYMTNSSGLRAENLIYMNAAAPNANPREPVATDIDHKTPITFGLAVSYLLNDRFALQSGLTYSYLVSAWETTGTYHGETTQGLHFVGIPLNLTYLIVKWNRLQLYGTAGVMGEINVAGRKTTRLYEEDNVVGNMPEKVRMDAPMWSLNARVGVSYPLIRFISVYAEAGAGYYFDNGSDIETIRSDKPFNVGLQVGFRLGF